VRRQTALGITVLSAITASLVGVTPAVAVPEAGPEVSWLSTGDSYSSGEGVLGNLGDCAQSDNAWGQAARSLLDEQGWTISDSAFSACTGHLAEDFYNPRPGSGKGDSLWSWGKEQAGVDRFDVITMSFGGNDIGFADVILDCLAAPIHRYQDGEFLDRPPWETGSWVIADAVATSMSDFVPFLGDDCDTERRDIDRRIESLFDPPNECRDGDGFGWRGRDSEHANFDCAIVIDAAAGVVGSMVDLWEHVIETSLTPTGVLVVQGYPQLFAPSAEWGMGQGLRCNGVTRVDANMLNDLSEQLDRALAAGIRELQQRVGSERVVYSSVVDLYRNGGHGLCGPGEDWVNGAITLTRDEPAFVVIPTLSGARLGANSGFRIRYLGAFHPKANAHAAEARQVADLLIGSARAGAFGDNGSVAELTSCEGTDLGEVVGDLAQPVVCSYPWGLAETTTTLGDGPSVIVTLLHTADRRLVESWWTVEDGPELSGYSVESIIQAGVPEEAARLLFDTLDACAGCAFNVGTPTSGGDCLDSATALALLRNSPYPDAANAFVDFCEGPIAVGGGEFEGGDGFNAAWIRRDGEWAFLAASFGLRSVCEAVWSYDVKIDIGCGSNFRWPYADFFSVPQLGVEEVRGSGCGGAGEIGEQLPDGIWNGFATNLSASTIDFDLACVYYGESARPFIDEFLETTPIDEAPYLDEDYWVVNNTVRNRTVRLASSFVYRDAEWIDGPACIDPGPMSDSSADTPGGFIDSWIMIENGEAVFLLRSCLYG